MKRDLRNDFIYNPREVIALVPEGSICRLVQLWDFLYAYHESHSPCHCERQRSNPLITGDCHGGNRRSLATTSREQYAPHTAGLR